MSCWQHGSLFPSIVFHFFVEVCLVVNLIFYHLLSYSTSFLEAFIFGLSLIVNSIHSHTNFIFLLWNIFSSIVCSKLFLLRFPFNKLSVCRWSWHTIELNFINSYMVLEPPSYFLFEGFLKPWFRDTNPSLFVHFSSIRG